MIAAQDKPGAIVTSPRLGSPRGMAPVIDSHQHFWRYGSYQTSWMEQSPYAGDPGLEPIRRSFGPADLLLELRAAGVNGSVTVEAADDPAENASLLAQASACPWIAGVVGWVPLERPDETQARLDDLAPGGKLVGMRHLINVESDPDWILRPAVLEGLALLAGRGLAFDYVGILPRHLEHVPRIAERVPGLRIVIDHLGKPPLGAPGFERWAFQLALAAQAPNVVAKISGLDVGAGDRWSAADLRRPIDHALKVFGPRRLMLGSDWPVAMLRGGYAKVWSASLAALCDLGPADLARVLGGTAIEFYRLDVSGLRA